CDLVGRVDRLRSSEQPLDRSDSLGRCSFEDVNDVDIQARRENLAASLRSTDRHAPRCNTQCRSPLVPCWMSSSFCISRRSLSRRKMNVALQYSRRICGCVEQFSVAEHPISGRPNHKSPAVTNKLTKQLEHIGLTIHDVNRGSASEQFLRTGHHL